MLGKFPRNFPSHDGVVAYSLRWLSMHNLNKTNAWLVATFAVVGAEEIKKQAGEGAVIGGVDFTGATALHLAAVYGHDEAAEVLLQAGAQSNLADRQADHLDHFSDALS